MLLAFVAVRLVALEVAGAQEPKPPTPHRPAADAKAPDYQSQIAPLFRKFCAGCHNATDKEGGLVLDDYASLVKGGKRGAALVPSEPNRSRLLLMLAGTSKPKMPPEGNEGPSGDEIALLRA
ncbi:MAG: hypothetical protein HYS13_04285, partial [Planctomycetia bacterium]|nr:hypothetical protein [Planctomycetia bacterium]